MSLQTDRIAEELAHACAGIDGAAAERFAAEIAKARRIVVFGLGRERLQIMGFSMRLYHLGLAVSVAGDVTAPPVGPGDLFIATVGPGELATATALLDIARKAGARTQVITAQATGASVKLADDVLLIPAQTMADDRGERASILPMGSVFEGALFIFFEAMVLKLKERLGVSAEAMRANHTNLE